MSGLQTRAKLSLLPLALGKHIDFSIDAQRAIAAWATMFTIVAEYLDPETASVGLYERQLFREQQAPPPGWRIWLGNYGKGDRLFYNHYGFGVALNGEPPTDPNAQATVFSVGKCLFYVVSSPIPLVSDYDELARSRGLATIWPSNVLKSTPQRAYTFEDLRHLGDEIAQSMGGRVIPLAHRV